ncbi:MAG: VWA domain-containing protein [Phycisphaerales bacterium]
MTDHDPHGTAGHDGPEDVARGASGSESTPESGAIPAGAARAKRAMQRLKMAQDLQSEMTAHAAGGDEPGAPRSNGTGATPPPRANARANALDPDPADASDARPDVRTGSRIQRQPSIADGIEGQHQHQSQDQHQSQHQNQDHDEAQDRHSNQDQAHNPRSGPGAIPRQSRTGGGPRTNHASDGSPGAPHPDVDATSAGERRAEERHGRSGRRSRIGSLGLSALIHGGLIVVLGLLSWGAASDPDPAPTVGVADTPRPPGPMGGSGGSALAAERTNEQPTTSAAAAAMSVQVPAPPAPSLEAVASPAQSSPAMSQAEAASALAGALAAETAAPVSGAGAGGTGGTLSGTSSGFRDLAGAMGQSGLDVVLVLDTTESMGPTLGAARERLLDLVSVLTGVLDSEDANAERLRIGVVAFKDYGDEYGLDAVDGTPLTGDIDRVRTFLESLVASGGGDVPEPIHVALAAAADRRMGWKRGRRKCVVLIGDAPVHASGRDEAVKIARAFKRQGDGTISVLDTDQRRGSVLSDFAAIATQGGGSAMQLTDVDAFWRAVIVGIFGEQYAADVDVIVDRYAGHDHD